MQSEQYTADAICRAMGLPGFIDPGWLESNRTVLRLLLTPSFHPEVCITLATTTNGVQWSVVALRESLEQLKPLGQVLQDSEIVTMETECFPTAKAAFMAAVVDIESGERFACLDGLGVESCLASEGQVRRFHANADCKGVAGMVRQLVVGAWEVCHDPHVKNGLSTCAGYIGLALP